ncbi:MAG: alpha/beta fold hydrolase [Deferrisomatales bacterium]
MTMFLAGRPDAQGRALVLVHGAGGDHKLWGAVFRRLRTRRIPALAVDLPGHGRSPGPGRASVAAYGRDLTGLLEEQGVREHALAGHSLGGAIALWLAAVRAPGLRGLGAVSTGARLPVDPTILKGMLQAFSCTVENLARFCFAKGTPEETWREAATTMAAAGPVVLHGDFAACAAYGVSDEELSGLRVPAEVVCGEADILTPMPLSEELAQAIPGAQLTRIPRCGHMPLLEAPDALADALLRLWERSFPALPP